MNFILEVSFSIFSIPLQGLDLCVIDTIGKLKAGADVQTLIMMFLRGKAEMGNHH